MSRASDRVAHIKKRRSGPARGKKKEETDGADG
jgi:hypothetical protein